MQICSSVRADGTPCKARALPGRAACFAHDDAQKAARDAGRQTGGKNKATVSRLGKRMPASLRPVLDTLYDALTGVRDGDIEPKQGTALATIASAIARIYETAELDARLAALEAQTEKRTG